MREGCRYTWTGKGIALSELGKYEEAIKACKQAIDINRSDAFAYIYLGELFFKLCDLENAFIQANEALTINENLVPALSLKGRIEIEEKNYDAACISFKKAISLNIVNPIIILWNSYAKYLKLEFSSDSNKKYQEELISIIRNLEKADTLCKTKYGKEIRSYILYFLGIFYLKSNDIVAAKEKLEECINLKSKTPIEATARELLYNVWNYQIKPPFWRWWLNSPLHKWCKRVTFFLLLLFVVGLLLFHPFIPRLFPSLKINWFLYSFFTIFLLSLIFWPSIERIKAKDIEVELHSPTLIEPILSPQLMEEKIKTIEENYPQFKIIK